MSAIYEAVVTLTDSENAELDYKQVYDFSFGREGTQEDMSQSLHELLEDRVGELDIEPIVQEVLNAQSECWTWNANLSEGATFYYSIQDSFGETLYRLTIELS